MLRLRGYVSEYYGQKGVFDEFVYSDEFRDVVGLEINVSAFEKAFRRFWWRCVQLALEEKPDVCLVGLSEALKVRVISKGPPMTYFVLKVFQKFLLKGLQKLDLFELTGTPVTEEVVNRKIGRQGLSALRDLGFHSGDLESATDLMESWFSEMISDELFNLFEQQVGFPLGVFRELFLRSLTRHNIYRVEGKDERIFCGAQKIGQLMGSIISFPILCIGNAVGSRIALEIVEGRRFSLRGYPGWINGDDVFTLYTSGYAFDEIWTGVMGFMGFKKSVGKCYDSEQFFNINSTTFEVDPRTGNFTLVPYVNLGLIKGEQRSVVVGKKGQTKDVDIYQLGVILRELMETCPVELKPAVHAMFIDTHRHRLERYPLPWYLPIWAGGLGLLPIGPLSIEDQQLLLAAKQRIAKHPTEIPVYTGKKEWQHYAKCVQYTRTLNPLVTSYPFRDVNCIGRRGLGEYETRVDDDFIVPISYKIWEYEGLSSLYKPHKSEEYKCMMKAATLIDRLHMKKSKWSKVYGRALEYDLNAEPKPSVFPVYTTN